MAARRDAVLVPRSFGWTASVALVIALPGCTASGRGIPRELPRERGVVVKVQNASFEDLNVYLVRGATKHHLGNVGAASSAALAITASTLGTGEVEILAVARRSEGPRRSTGTIQLYPGDTVEWSIDNHRASHSLRRGHFD